MMKEIILFLLFFSFLLQSATNKEKKTISNKEVGDYVTHVQEVYKTIDTLQLKVDIFFTNQTLKKENNTAIVFFHGGGWAYGTPNEFFTTCERYAKLGIVTFSVEYRLANINDVTSKSISPIECVMDAKTAIRWVRENSEKFHIAQNKIVAAGQSAGGHLALCTEMIEDYSEKSDNINISCKPNAILLFSSCVNAVEGWCDRLLKERREKIWSISPSHNIKPGLPPMIEFHGIDDEQVPKWTVQFFETEMQENGNYFELHLYEGRKHYLGGENSMYSHYYDEGILKITDDFLRKNRFLE